MSLRIVASEKIRTYAAVANAASARTSSNPLRVRCRGVADHPEPVRPRGTQDTEVLRYTGEEVPSFLRTSLDKLR
jgi:hypothetical protein